MLCYIALHLQPAPSSAKAMDLNGKHIVLGLTGGIACYKAAELCRALVKEGATVQVVMTEAAAQFITPLTWWPRPAPTSWPSSRKAAPMICSA
jgi:Flavoprotein